MDHPFIVGFCEALADEGVAALRFNFPYLEAGRRTPGSPKDAIARRSARRSRRPPPAAGGRPVFAGGKSYGGRIASMAAAEGMPAAGLVFLGYPLHAPGKPDQVRDAHLYDLRARCSSCRGRRTRSPTRRARDGARGSSATARRYVRFEGAGHSFERSRKDDARRRGASLAPHVGRVRPGPLTRCPGRTGARRSSTCRRRHPAATARPAVGRGRRLRGPGGRRATRSTAAPDATTSSGRAPAPGGGARRRGG